jgi:hypothetical protein
MQLPGARPTQQHDRSHALLNKPTDGTCVRAADGGLVARAAPSAASACVVRGGRL